MNCFLNVNKDQDILRNRNSTMFRYAIHLYCIHSMDMTRQDEKNIFLISKKRVDVRVTQVTLENHEKLQEKM